MFLYTYNSKVFDPTQHSTTKMASTIYQIYFLLSFFCLFQILISSRVTFYEKQNFKGPSFGFNVGPNTCHNIPSITWSSRISSVNTYGTCFLGWVQQNCSGNTKELRSKPGVLNNFGPKTSHGPLNIKSTSLCSTKIYSSNGYPNNQKAPELWKTAASEHNKYRKLHNSPMLRSDDPKLHHMAQKYANYLARTNVFEHSQNIKHYGENLAWTNLPKNKNDAVKEAVKNWYSEEKLYNYNHPVFSTATGHFTTMVWKNTHYVGIGVAWSSQRRWWVIVANYFSPGNIQTQFTKNVQRPHKKYIFFQPFIQKYILVSNTVYQ